MRFLGGEHKSDSAAWTLPGPVQTVYRAELFAVLVALEVFRGDLEIVSDCKGVIDEAERIRAGGKVSPTSKHTDPWTRYKDAPKAHGIRQVLVRWVPSHEEEGSDRITPGDRAGNDHADKLANAHAKIIGPTALQGKLYDRRTEQLEKIQDIQLRILTVAQETNPPRTQDRGPQGRSARPGRQIPACLRKCHLPTLQRGELRIWGRHLSPSTASTEGFRCISCARVANHKRARYALRTLPCSGRAGLAGPLQPRRPRLKWNRANESRWKRQGEIGHQVVRYNTTQHDGRWLCMKCGLHYVQFCDLRTKPCTAAPASQAAAKAIADALAGGPLARRKVHAFAKHPSRSRPGAPGIRLPSDVVSLDPQAPKPPGPATPQAQADHLGSQAGGPRAGAPQQEMQAGDPGHADALRNTEPPGTDGQEESIPAHETQNGSPCQPAGAPAGGTLGVTTPSGPGTGK